MRRAPTPLVGIVADDLTGAMDASGAFAAHGLTARVMPSPSVSPPQTGPNHVLCYNTQTRDVHSAAVSQTVRKTTGLLLRQGCARLYKKIDSTLQGHVGLEILATL
ncbi:MAG: four-carbon acid sugar kinase family protein, partial [SAR202 cluster bacterium]|nr:four-carbon acid sugar kinase family protein [SAR202 cluster bacterium]